MIIEIKVHEIAKNKSILKKCIGHILHDELEMKKLCASWTLHLLTDQKCVHMKISEDVINILKRVKWILCIGLLQWMI